MPSNQGLEKWRTDRRSREQREVRSFRRCVGAGLGTDVTVSDSGEGVPLVPFIRLWVVVEGSSDGCGVGGPVA